MGQKSSYFINANNDTTEVTYPGCEPVMLWYLGRHGARKPSDKEIEKMAIDLPDLQKKILDAANQGEMCQEDLDHLRNWTFRFTVADHKILMESGVKEQNELGRRWLTRLPGLLGDSDKIHVRATYKQRTWASAKAFLEGMYNTTVDFPQVIVSDMLLRFYEHCPNYSDGVDSNNNTFTEKYKLMETEAYKDMVAALSKRAGLELTIADVEMAWAMCR